MKKLFAAASLTIALTLASCGGGSGRATVEGGLDSLFTAAQADTLVMSTAQVGGWEIGNMLKNAMEADSTFSKEEFLKGVKYIVDADSSSSFAFGIQIGTNINGTIKYWSQAGIKIDRNAFFRQFKKAVLQDSISMEERAFVNAANTRANSQFREAMAAYEEYKIESSELSQANIKKGQEFIDSLAAANPNVKVAASGLAYEITNPGNEKRATPDDLVELIFTGTTLDGRTFDKADSVSARLVPLRLRNEGLQQGVEMLGEGGEATFYIPGKLAFGTNRNSRFGLAPNELVTYTVKVNKIQTQEEAAKK
ncbi:MAG: FKBP-type peptidyl-prolyl cis-trans isomerase [Clostridium sp.]|nr:FKBP-type peptidyl-prolyl cis-trans isomerase [Clostridium sp.]